MVDAHFKKWKCGSCGYVYDEKVGIVYRRKVRPWTPTMMFSAMHQTEDVPDDWYCPECKSPHEKFVELE